MNGSSLEIWFNSNIRRYQLQGRFDFRNGDYYIDVLDIITQDYAFEYDQSPLDVCEDHQMREAVINSMNQDWQYYNHFIEDYLKLGKTKETEERPESTIH